jgi:hypothetical protein
MLKRRNSNFILSILIEELVVRRSYYVVVVSQASTVYDACGCEGKNNDRETTQKKIL